MKLEVYHFGTKAALLYAINEICPNSRIEEGNEYGGDPYYFRIILDAASVGKGFSLRTLMRLIDSIRPVRSILQDGEPILHSEAAVEISEESGYIIYTVRRCGVYPDEAVKGRIKDEFIAVILGADGAEFVSALSGTKHTGTIPSEAVSGIARDGTINLGTMGDAAAYYARTCGTSPGSLL